MAAQQNSSRRSVTIVCDRGTARAIARTAVCAFALHHDSEVKTLHQGDAGEILFMPFGWWHQVKALDFSLAITYTNFVWLNDSYRNYPTDS
jgi:hypothetical protein